MKVVLRVIAVFAILSVIKGSNAQQAPNFNVMELAQKLSELFKTISEQKVTAQDEAALFRFQAALVNTWNTLSSAFSNLEPSKALDAYIALMKNQREILYQILNVLNLDQLNKWSQLVSDTLNSVNGGHVNCTETGCELATPSFNFSTPSFNFSTPAWNWTTEYYNQTGFTTPSWNGSFVTEFPFNNFTTWYPNSNFTTDNWNWTTWTSFPSNWTDNPTNWTSWTSFPSNWTDSPTNWTSWTSFPSNWTDSPTNWTSWTSWPEWNTTLNWNSTFWTDQPQNVTWFTSPPSNGTWFTNQTNQINSTSAPNHIYIDSEFCQYYTLADCSNRIEISLLCPALCRCSAIQCQNNATSAIVQNTGECKCLCKPNFTGVYCESSLCTEKEYCSYFNDSYCSVSMIYDNCPKLCGKC